MLRHRRHLLGYLPGLRSYLCFSYSTHCLVLLQQAAAEQQQEAHGSISWPEPCQLQQMALGCRGMAGKLEVCSSPPLPTLPALVTSGKGPKGGWLGCAGSAGFIPASLWHETLPDKESYLWVA